MALIEILTICFVHMLWSSDHHGQFHQRGLISVSFGQLLICAKKPEENQYDTRSYADNICFVISLNPQNGANVGNMDTFRSVTTSSITT